MDPAHLLPHPVPQGPQDPGDDHLPGLEYTLTLPARTARSAAQHDASGRLVAGAGSRPSRKGAGVRVGGDVPGCTLTLG